MNISSTSYPIGSSSTSSYPSMHAIKQGKSLLTSNPKIGSGRPVKSTGTQIAFYQLLLAKNGFIEVPASALPEKARQQMAAKLGSNQAVSFYMNPASGEFCALTQNERSPNEVTMYKWNSSNESWTPSQY